MVSAIVHQVATSLREAHEAGLFHRDLKPQNIRLISPDGAPPYVKLLDFGIARSSDSGHPSITKTGELIGTPRYMSPEQLSGKPLGPESDVYSLGMVAFEMVMGPHALQGSNIFAQIDRMRSGHVFSMSELERANTGLMAVIQRMTTWDCGTPFWSCKIPGGAQWPGMSLNPTQALLCKEPTSNYATAQRMWTFFETVDPPSEDD